MQNRIKPEHLIKAKELGAVSVRIYCIKQKVYPLDWILEPFSYHFFNIDDVELCYYIEDIKDIVPMFIFTTPRVWSDEFKNNKDYIFERL